MAIEELRLFSLIGDSKEDWVWSSGIVFEHFKEYEKSFPFLGKSVSIKLYPVFGLWIGDDGKIKLFCVDKNKGGKWDFINRNEAANISSFAKLEGLKVLYMFSAEIWAVETRFQYEFDGYKLTFPYDYDNSGPITLVKIFVPNEFKISDEGKLTCRFEINLFGEREDIESKELKYHEIAYSLNLSEGIKWISLQIENVFNQLVKQFKHDLEQTQKVVLDKEEFVKEYYKDKFKDKLIESL